MLRAIFVITAIAIGLRYALRGPFYMLLFYLWMAYFRPEQWLWWDFFTSLNLSFIVGVALVFTTPFSKEHIRGGLGPWLLVSFLGVGLVSTLLSPSFNYAWTYWQEFARIIVVAFLMVSLVTSETRLRLVLLTIALSVGLEGAKQGWVQFFVNPGGMNPNTLGIFGDNNGTAVGMLMIVSVLTSVAGTGRLRIERLLIRFVAVGVFYRAIVTYSRGGFLAGGALALHAFAQSKRKLFGAAAALILVLTIVPVLPEAFWDRMSTITVATGSESTTEAEASIAGRRHFWQVAVLMANDRPLFGVGHNAFNAAYNRYDFSRGAFGGGRSVHSIWFGVLAELGYTGFALFTLLIARAFFLCRRTIHQSKTRPELANLARYAAAVEGGILVYCVGGSFVPMQYNELAWHFLALSMVIQRLTKETLAALPSSLPVPVSPPPYPPMAVARS